MADRYPSLPYPKPGPNGERYCRLCGKVVEGRRKTWCSDECVRAWQARSSSGGMRHAVKQRDRGVCAACSLDCLVLEEIVELIRWAIEAWPPVRSDLEIVAIARGFGDRTLWQADHIVEVEDGGGGCDLTNIQTLCHWCHGRKSGESRRARNLRRSEQLALA
ncbi:MAG TPA: HNH endonuclease [Methylomirabilota bacterium]|nr:HNH endonuclease [Methylomirabilota bacterium]